MLANAELGSNPADVELDDGSVDIAFVETKFLALLIENLASELSEKYGAFPSCDVCEDVDNVGDDSNFEDATAIGSIYSQSQSNLILNS
jgi:hypothetical protein